MWLVAVAATSWWCVHYDRPWAEPLSQVIIASGWCLTSIINWIIPADPGWIELSARQAKREADILKGVVETLEHEDRNFQQIQEKRGHYNSDAHKKAVEKTAFEQVRSQLEELAAFRGYQSQTTPLLQEIERNLAMTTGRDVERLRPLIHSLIMSLNKRIKQLARAYRGVLPE
jgi:hypothetical protein